MKLLHIVNPVKIGPQSDLFKAQPITFESMRRAAEYNKEVQVELLSTQYPEDEEIIPEYFIQLLTRQKQSVIQPVTAILPEYLNASHFFAPRPCFGAHSRPGCR